MSINRYARGIKKIVKNPWKAFFYLSERGYLDWLDDELFLRIMYRAHFDGKKLDLNNPQTYNEKIQWLKLYDRRPEYTTMVDKYEAKLYAERIIGGKYIVPTLGVWNHFDEIDFNKLPNQFVLKCTHDCGGLVICKNKEMLDKIAARQKIERCLKNNYYHSLREWPYKNVKPRIIAETYLEDSATHDLRDYKFFAFDGVPRAMFIATDRQNENSETKFDFYDMDFNHLDLINGHPNAIIPPQKPKSFEEMKRLAGLLSKGIPQLRVDFYEVDGRVYLGELTFAHWGGIVPFDPPFWDRVFGDWITLPEKTIETRQR